MASTYLSRTPASTGNQSTYTFSGWIKKCGSGSVQQIIGSYYGNQSRYAFFQFNSDDTLSFFSGNYTTASTTTQSANKQTSRLFRDPSAWYHIVLSVDTTQATATDRVKLYVNGVQETWDTGYAYNLDPSQNDTHFFNVTTNAMEVGAMNNNQYFNGSMSHVHWIDGTAYDASTFGQEDATTRIWKPKTAPSVTYGTNGFFLKFENSANMDLDSSPNNLTFSTSGTLTQTVDTPSNVFATLNPLYPYTSTGAFTNGNTAPSDYNNTQGIVGTLGVSTGKWYYEVKINGNAPSEIGMVGWGARDNGAINYSGGEAYDYCRYLLYANYYNNASATAISGASAYSSGDICGCALDLDGNKIYWYKNGVLENTGGTTITASSTAGNYFPLVRNGNGSNIQCNFGNGYFGTTPVASAGSNGNGAIFEYDVPTGYYALNTKNINTYG